MKFKLAAMLAGIALFAAAPVWAGTVTYNFTGSDVSIPSPSTFTSGGISITAYGVVGGSNNDLYQKGDGASEDGLGLSGTTDNEINPGGQEIVLDLTNLITAGYTEGTLTLGSLQTGEGAQICDSDSLAHAKAGSTLSGCTGQILGGSNAIGTSGQISLGTGYLVFTTDNSRSAPNGNYLISELDASTPTTTPEPATLVLFGTALMGLGLISKRFRGAKALR